MISDTLSDACSELAIRQHDDEYEDWRMEIAVVKALMTALRTCLDASGSSHLEGEVARLREAIRQVDVAAVEMGVKVLEAAAARAKA
jgi:hypothetical protein